MVIKGDVGLFQLCVVQENHSGEYSYLGVYFEY